MPRFIRTGKGNKRTFAEREEQLILIAQRVLQQVRLVDIAAEFNLSVSMIKKDINLIRQRWREQQHDLIDEHIGRELQKLDIIEGAAWESWEASKKISTDSKALDAGDPRYLTVVLSSMERRARILGLERPAEQNINIYNAENIGFAVVNTPELLEHEKQFWALQAAMQKQPGSLGHSVDSGD